MSVIHAPSRPELDGRLLVFPLGTLAVLLVLFLRLWYFQVVRADELTDRGEMYQRSSVSKLAPRGLIYDRKGVLLAGARPELVLTAVPAVVNQKEWVIDRAAAMLGVEVSKLKEKVRAAAWKPYLPGPIYIGVPVDVATRVAESGEALPGLAVETQPMRYYPDSKSFTHVLGYASVPNTSDVERLTEMGLKPAAYVGRLGVEYVYEKELMGKPGSERVEVDAKRRPIRIVGRDNPVPGARLNLGIDAEVQQAAIRAFAGRRGGAVALDPKTGEVIALVSSPTYDLALFHGGISRAAYSKLQSDPDKPLLNRAMYGAYQPGSTFKIVTTVAAMRAGVFSPHQLIYCPGYFAVGKRKLRCLGVHGAIPFRAAMARSCNTYFSTLAYRTGGEVLRRTARDFGLGQRAGIDLLGEGPGLIPTDELLKRWRGSTAWYVGDTLNMGIGQGETQCTPLQMANVAAMVANSGVVYKPRLVRAVRPPTSEDAEYIVPEVARKIDLPERNWELIRDALTAVITDGTAHRSGSIPGLLWAGKTGSAEHHVKDAKTHGWFVAFAPAHDPKIALAVVVEAAGHGGEVAVPIATEMVKAYLRLGSSGSAARANAPSSSPAAAASAPRPAAR